MTGNNTVTFLTMPADDGNHQDELQKKMASLVAELQGVMSQMQNGGGAAAAAAVAAATATMSQTPGPFDAIGGTENPFGAFPIPGVSTSTAASSSLDQDLARLLHMESDPLRAPSSAPSTQSMETNRWLANMLSHVGGHQASSMEATTSSAPMSVTAGSTAPKPSAAPNVVPVVRRGPHGAGGGGYNSGHPYAARGSYPMEYYPHGRPGPSFPPSTASGSGGGSATGASLPQDSAIVASMPSGMKTSPPSSTTKASSINPAAPAFKPSVAAKPFRPTGPQQPQIGAPITAQASQLLREAFGGYPLLQEVQPLEDEDSVGPRGSNSTRGKGARMSASSNSGPRRRVEPQIEEEHMDATMPMAYVEFKRQKIKKYPVEGVITPGQYVIVDGDRGQDCGLLVQITAPTADGKLSVLAMEGSALEDQKLRVEQGRVIRVAEPAEVDMLHNQIAASERNALRACRQKCKEMGLTIEILDCEYQFDMKKISFYFNSDRSVDFRDLVRDLYRTFGARIWMENINPNVKNVVPSGPSHKHH